MGSGSDRPTSPSLEGERRKSANGCARWKTQTIRSVRVPSAAPEVLVASRLPVHMGIRMHSGSTRRGPRRFRWHPCVVLELTLRRRGSEPVASTNFGGGFARPRVREKDHLPEPRIIRPLSNLEQSTDGGVAFRTSKPASIYRWRRVASFACGECVASSSLRRKRVSASRTSKTASAISR